MFAITDIADAIAWPQVIADNVCQCTGQTKRSLVGVRATRSASTPLNKTTNGRCKADKGRKSIVFDGPSSRPALWTQTKHNLQILIYFLLLVNISTVCAFTEADMEQLASSISSQSNGALPSASTDSASSSSSGAVVTLRSNLSCYVCMTVEDMRCKFINETNKHIYQLDEELATLRSTGDQHLTAGNKEDIQELLTSYGGIHGGDRSLMTASTEMLDPDSSGSGPISGEYGGGGTSADQAHHIFGAECMSEEHYCSVFRMGVSPPQNIQSQEFNFFALIRTCSKSCNPGCFIIGERTKLSFCVTCCTSNYCNYGNSAVRRRSVPRTLAVAAISGVITVLSVIAAFRRL